MPKWCYTEGPNVHSEVISDEVDVRDGCLEFTSWDENGIPQLVLLVAAGHWVNCFKEDDE